MSTKDKPQNPPPNLPTSSHPKAEVGVRILIPAKPSKRDNPHSRKLIVSVDGRDVDEISAPRNRAA